MSRRYIQHLRSKEVETIQQYGLDKDIPKLPESDNLKDGEIAINYAKDYEVISIKNDNNKVVKFLNEKVIYEDEEITAAAISQLKNETNQQINDIHNIIDNIDPSATAVQSDWDETDEESLAYIKNKPTITTVNDAPLIIQKNGTDVATFTANAAERVFANIEVPTKTSDLHNDSGFITTQIQSDWDEDDQTSMAFIQNKPTALSDFTNDLEYQIVMGKIDGVDFYRVVSSSDVSQIFSDTPEDGNVNKIYVDILTNRSYRWTDSLIPIGESRYKLLSEDLNVVSDNEINSSSPSTVKRAVSAKVLRDNFYTKSETDTALSLKQDIDDVYVDQAYVDTNTTNSFASNNKRYNIVEDITLTTDATYAFGSGCILHFYNAGKLNGAANLALNNTQIEAPMKQCFDLNVNFTGLMKNSECYPEWWGAVGDGETDDAAAINRCIYCACHTPVVLTAENYLVKSTVGPDYKVKNTAANSATHTGWGDTYAAQFIVKHNIIGDVALAGPVVRFAISYGYCKIDGTILVRNTSDDAVGFTTCSSDVTLQCINSDISIGRIDKGTWPLSSLSSDSEGIGLGTGAALIGIWDSTIKIYNVRGFKEGCYLSRFGTNDLWVGRNECVYCFYLGRPKTSWNLANTNWYVHRSRMTLGEQFAGLSSEAFVTEAADSAIIKEDGNVEIAMNTWVIGDSNNGYANCRHPHKHSLYYISGNGGHTGNKYTFNITYGIETSRKFVKFDVPSSSKGPNGDEINFGVGCFLQDIDIPYAWNVKLHNVILSNTAKTKGTFRWGGDSGEMLIDTVTITRASTPIFNSSTATIYLLDINPQHNGNIISADTVPATCEDNKFYVVDGTGVITTNGTKKYPVYCKYFGTDATLIGYTLNPTFAPIFSPAFTGTPTTPTPNVFDNSTQIANTAYVHEYVGKRINNVADHMITATYDDRNDVYNLDMTFADVVARVEDDLEGSNMFVQLWLNDNNLKFKFARFDEVNQFVYFDCDADVGGVLTHYELMYSDDGFAVLTATPIQDKLVSGTNVSSQVTFSDDFINRCSYNYTDDTWITL